MVPAMTTTPSGAASTWQLHDLEVAASSKHWCATRDNPPCVPWCARGHDPNDFRVAGCLICARAFGRGVEVQVVQIADDDQPGRVVPHPVEVVVLDARPEMVPGVARALAGALLAAADFAEGLA